MDNLDKTEMSELVETLRAAALEATGGNTDTPWKYDKFTHRVSHWTGTIADCRYRRGHLDGPFIALASPRNILKLLSSLPPSGAASEATIPARFVLDLLRKEIQPVDLLNFDYAVNGRNNMIERISAEIARYGAEALNED